MTKHDLRRKKSRTNVGNLPRFNCIAMPPTLLDSTAAGQQMMPCRLCPASRNSRGANTALTIPNRHRQMESTRARRIGNSRQCIVIAIAAKRLLPAHPILSTTVANSARHDLQHYPTNATFSTYPQTATTQITILSMHTWLTYLTGPY